jgi:hypothetical protein
MSETKFTPGPWRVEQDTTLIWGDCNPDDTTSYGMGYPIAECRVTRSASWAKGPRGHGEAEANARLIAVAPEMFEALKATLPVLEASEGFINRHAFDVSGGKEDPLLGKVRAALRRALGSEA